MKITSNTSWGEVEYRIGKYPDGQQNVVILNHQVDSVSVKTRLNNWQDLELLCCAVASLRAQGTRIENLTITYLVGARSDRQFERGGNNYLKSVIAPIINSLNIPKVYLFEPHSIVAESVINNAVGISNKGFFDWVKENIEPDTHIVSPDAGATKRAELFKKETANENDIIYCFKQRNADQISSVVNIRDIQLDVPLLVVDDLCDGGGTFISLAKELNKKGHKAKKYLMVSHGVFSKGLDELNKYYNKIFTTNSYSDRTDIQQYDEIY